MQRKKVVFSFFIFLLGLFISVEARGVEPFLGVGNELFPFPRGLERAVAFWEKIFTRYTSYQAVIHHTDNFTIYQILNFAPQHRESYKRPVVKGALAKYQRRFGDKVRVQYGLRDKFIQGIRRSGRYMEQMEGIFRRYGLPVELTRLAFVESMFNTKAISRKGASGVWQFMPSTGRLFLKINYIVDERNDPLLATEAAAKLLKNNYQILGSWPLAITAYNHGLNGVQKAVSQVGSKDIRTIINRYRGSAFGFASKNFYAEFLTALHVYKNRHPYFGPIEVEKPIRYEMVEIKHPLPMRALVKYCSISKEEIESLNPALKRAVINSWNYLPKGFFLRVPVEKKSQFLVAYNSIPHGSYMNRAYARRTTTSSQGITHRVARGQTLSTIAKKYGTSAHSIARYNGLENPHRLQVGQILTISTGRVFTLKPRVITHRISPGQTLSSIAKKYGTSWRSIAQYNGLRNPYRLKVGQVLTIPLKSKYPSL